ncbi:MULTISPECIES: hypothetical protein [Leptospira]|uniref:Lipoprotein n=1 Tax=Leptospira congkakensis TaxID=2484932 RepID=A0A4Z1A1X5_9LEPT|nr:MULTISPECIES: hypothetical protein [Leptospira]MCW7469758.1 hypothetical protein [Leptospira kanakyensis]TGL87509.1 hypothetical protein EHQ69_15435 [Leptospira congkakensis]TGL89876.1 hypothetical protein EHQ68_07725 [Leptospira congkakensis]TGL95658.1 hypothetical protein EHQ70_11105 [Leptospira congkakensis]
MIRKLFTYISLFGILSSVSCNVLEAYEINCLNDEFIYQAIDDGHQKSQEPCDGKDHKIEDCFCQKDYSIFDSIKYIKPVFTVSLIDFVSEIPNSLIKNLEYQKPELVFSELYYSKHLNSILLLI